MAGLTAGKARRGRPRKEGNWTARLLKERAREYFSSCDGRTKRVLRDGEESEVPWPAPYTLEGLCNYLSLSTMTLRNWCAREDELGEAARMMRQRVLENRVTGALDGTQNPAFARFMLVNNSPEEYREKMEVAQSLAPELKELLDQCRTPSEG